jgi:hypothetical protein
MSRGSSPGGSCEVQRRERVGAGGKVPLIVVEVEESEELASVREGRTARSHERDELEGGGEGSVKARVFRRQRGVGMRICGDESAYRPGSMEGKETDRVGKLWQV